MRKGTKHSEGSLAKISEAKKSPTAKRPYHRGQFVHRAVLEAKLGRKLKPSEHSHHKDEDTRNNDPSNLEALTHSEHSSLHSRGVANPMFGITHTEETKEEISSKVKQWYATNPNPKKGVKRDKETVAKIALALVGRAPTRGTTGKKLSDETRAKMRLAQAERRKRERSM